mgnify:CR=1 FL=1
MSPHLLVKKRSAGGIIEILIQIEIQIGIGIQIEKKTDTGIYGPKPTDFHPEDRCACRCRRHALKTLTFRKMLLI